MSVKQIVKHLAKIAGNKRSRGASYHGKIYARTIGIKTAEMSASDGAVLAIVRMPADLIPPIRDRVFVPVEKALRFAEGYSETCELADVPVWHRSQVATLPDTWGDGDAPCNPAYMAIAFELVKACDQEARVIVTAPQDPIIILGEGKASSDVTCMVMVMPLRERKSDSPTLYDLGRTVASYQGVQ